jgi:malonyl CoA-acyl carrier protein transacylase/phosphoglycolate phosphatase-like HAD superfamily hydrolase/1-acyl-sn-glycerol-3-phosphate acyltransferase
MPKYFLFTLSSDTYQGLLDIESEFINLIKSDKDSKLNLDDVCYLANKKYSDKACRVAIVTCSIEELIGSLQLHITGVINENTYYHESSDTLAAIIFLFSCQGFEYENMGKDLYDNFPIFKETIDQCEEVLLQEWNGVSLKQILWGERSSEISRTLYNHPVLCSLEYATYKLWTHLGLKPNILMGHSIGEYVALAVAGVLPFRTMLKLVAQRSRIFELKDCTGKMLSILETPDAILKTLKNITDPGTAFISAINGKYNVVVSGIHSAIDKINEYYLNLGVKTKQLKSEHAFHSPLMASMLDDFNKCLLHCGKLYEPNLPILSTVTGDYIGTDLNFYAHIKQHLVGEVKFYNAITKALFGENIIFLEIGPDDALCQMGQRCLVETDSSIIWQPSMLHGEKELHHLLNVMAILYIQGINFNWNNLYDLKSLNNLDMILNLEKSQNIKHAPQHQISTIAAKIISEHDQSKQRTIVAEYLLKKIKDLSHGQFKGQLIEDESVIDQSFDSLVIVRLKDDLVKDFEIKLSIFEFFNGLKWSDIIELCLESMRINAKGMSSIIYENYKKLRNPNVHFEALFFDLDGTLWDSLEMLVNSRNQAFFELGLDLKISAQNIRDSMSYPSRVLLHRTFPDLQPHLIEKLNTHYQKIVDAAAKGNSAILYPGVIEVLQELKKTYKLFLVSTCRQNYMYEFLKLPGVSGIFDDNESTGDTQRTKQSSIEDIMSRHSIKHSCYIGDTDGDYNSAVLAGSSFIFAKYGYGKCDMPCLKISSIQGLTNLLHKIEQPKNLFNNSRFIAGWDFWKYILFIIYIPLGILLLLVRLPLFFAWQLLGHSIPLSPVTSKIYFKFFQVITGGVVKISGHGVYNKLANAKIIVCNHISTLDSNYWMSVCQSSVVVREGVAMSPVYKLSMRAKNAFVVNSKDFFGILTNRLTEGKMPVLVFPEGATTSGRVGLLRFSPLVFSLEQSILPVALSINTPFPIALTKIKQGFMIDLLWVLFIPYKIYSFKILGFQSKKNDESAIDFADRVQYLIANETGVFPTLFTYQDKNKLRGQL